MNDKKFASEPMLYIQQPSINRPEAPMQHHYTSPKKANETLITESKSVEKGNRNSAPRKKVRRNTFQQQLSGLDEQETELVSGDKVAEGEERYLSEKAI